MQSVKTDKRRSSKRQAVYVEGSAARNLYALPDKGSPKSPQKHKKKPNQPARTAVRPRQGVTTLPLSGASVLVLTVAAVFTLIMCVQYVQLQSEITYRLKNINQLETELNELVLQNNETDNRINSFIDLDYIYRVSTQELGMRYANKNQIYKYNNSGAEYIRQYKEIPE